MATYTKRGKSYRIRSSVGYTPEGKQVMKSMTWTPTPGMTERQIEKELNRQMVLFDEQCRGSSLIDGHIKFEAFAGQWFSEYVEKTLGKRTQANYKQLAPRIYQSTGWPWATSGKSPGGCSPNKTVPLSASGSPINGSRGSVKRTACPSMAFTSSGTSMPRC